VVNGEAEIILDREKIKEYRHSLQKSGSKKVKKTQIFTSLK
jgi:hypothetical protein